MSGRADVRTGPGRLLRVVYRRIAGVLPTDSQTTVTRSLLRLRRAVRAPMRPALIDVPGTDRTVLLVALEVDEDGLRTALRDAAVLRQAGERVLLVTDRDDVVLLRAEGVLFELVPRRDALRAAGVADPDVFLRDRIAALVSTYRPDTMVAVEGSAPLPAAD